MHVYFENLYVVFTFFKLVLSGPQCRLFHQDTQYMRNIWNYIVGVQPYESCGSSFATGDSYDIGDGHYCNLRPNWECVTEENSTKFFIQCNRTGLATKDYMRKPMPDLAPYEEDYCIDPLGGLDFTRREFFRRIFSKAFYLKECELTNKTIIKTIYYWPGQRVELPCVVCHRTALYNGQIKNWAFLGGFELAYFIDDIERSWIIPHSYPFKWLHFLDRNHWIVLSHEAGQDLFRLKKFFNCETPAGSPADRERKCYEPVQMPSRNASYVPLFRNDKGYDEIRQEKNNSFPYNEPRPNTTFIQRDGKLIILTPDMDAYGMYRCFDQQTKGHVKFVYLLIPHTPIYFRNNTAESKPHIHRGECGITCEYKHKENDADVTDDDRHCMKQFASTNNIYNLPIVDYPEYGDQKNFWRFDIFHRFRFLPPRFKDTLERFKEKCNEQKNSTFCKNGIFDTNYNSTISVVSRDYNKESDKERCDIQKAINLKIAIHWTNWTSCANNQTYRTRKGYCVMKKLNPEKKFPTETEAETVYTSNRWVLQVHHFLESVDEFKKNGISIFSGVMVNLLDQGASNPYYCNRYKTDSDGSEYGPVNSFRKLFLDKIQQEISKDDRLNLCFFGQIAKDNGNETVYGYPIFDTELCPPPNSNTPDPDELNVEGNLDCFD